ncbi:MAG TPA: hypothetical protein VFL36_21525 [Myxococcales bacterium]|nr:hypothetical protein [Myxococcales bacterium]
MRPRQHGRGELVSLALAVAALSAGCPSNLEQQSHVSKLRVLAVRVDPAELILDPDAGLPSATLTALAVQADGGPISVQFALCTEITFAPSPTLPCPGDAGIELPESGPVSALLDLSDPRILAFARAAQLDGGFDAGGGIESTLDVGVPLLLGFTARADAQRIDGFQTLTLRSPARGPADLNPELLDLQIGDGGPVAPGETVRLQPDAGPKDDPAKRYGYSFFATAGEISSLRSTDTTATGQAAETWVEWKAPDAGGEVRFWVVVRDGRGGTAWIERATTVTPR